MDGKATLPAFSLIDVKLMFRRVPAVVRTIKRKKMTELTKDTKHNRQDEFAMVQIYRSLLTFFSSLSSSRYFKFPNSTQQQKKTYHKAIKQSQTVYEQSPNHLVRHDVPTATEQGTPSRNQDLGHPRSLIFRCLLAGEGQGKTRREKTEHWSLIPFRISLV